jgi:tetratricopeptide (TPR) repeat protein
VDDIDSRRAMRRRIAFMALGAAAVLALAAGGLHLWWWNEQRLQPERLAACERGKQAGQMRAHAESIALLSQCLDAWLPDVERSYVLRIRAWNHARLDRHVPAVTDMEAAFKLRPPMGYRDLMDYAVSLREAGRAEDSLKAVLEAERTEGGNASPTTLYHKGAALQELGQSSQAVTALSLAIGGEPYSPYAHWRRALAYEALGNAALAKADFARAERLLRDQGKTVAGEKLRPALYAKLREHGLD